MPSQAPQAHRLDHGAVQVGVFQVGYDQDGVGQIGVDQDGVGEITIIQPGIAEVGTGEVDAAAL